MAAVGAGQRGHVVPMDQVWSQVGQLVSLILIRKVIEATADVIQPGSGNGVGIAVDVVILGVLAYRIVLIDRVAQRARDPGQMV